MRIQFKMEGGIAFFPGLSKPIVIETDALNNEQASELEQRIQAAHFFELPRTVGTPARGAADYRQYTITIEDRSKRHTVRLTEPIQDPSLQALLDIMNELRARGN
jgi:hypothetical protein